MRAQLEGTTRTAPECKVDERKGHMRAGRDTVRRELSILRM